MASAPDFSPLFSGFDFLQNLMKGAGSSLPGVSQWVTPTLDPEELDRRIQELKTVQFWLEQNAKMLATTIQTLEVQRMTLTTLKAMNVQAADLAEAFRVRQSQAFATGSTTTDDPQDKDPTPSASAASSASASGANRFTDDTASTPPEDPPAGLVDPMQWWGSLTQQFSQIASQAMSDGQVVQAMNDATQKAGAMAGQMMQTAQALGAALKPGTGKRPEGSGKGAKKTRASAQSPQAPAQPRADAQAQGAKAPAKKATTAAAQGGSASRTDQAGRPQTRTGSINPSAQAGKSTQSSRGKSTAAQPAKAKSAGAAAKKR